MSATLGENIEEQAGTQPVTAAPATTEPAGTPPAPPVEPATPEPAAPQPMSPRNGPIEPLDEPLRAAG